MDCSIKKSVLNGKIICPSNKTYTHRAFFLATLAQGKSMIKNALKSRDTNATLNACKCFGAIVKENEFNITIQSSTNTSNTSIINAENSGTTIRIAAVIASLFNKTTVLTGDESLKKRPMEPILDALEVLGARCSSNNGLLPLKITGSIVGGDVTIAGNISSQFISALMITAPCTKKGILLNIENTLISKYYVDATIAIMKKFGVDVDTILPYKKYYIPHKKYVSTTVSIPSDFSNLALLLSASVLVGNNLTIEIMINDMPQNDIIMIEILKILGVVVTINKNIISIKSPPKLNGGKFDLVNNPDLLPPLAVLALKTSEPIEIFNVKHARYKETDRISVISREFKKLGIAIKENDDGLVLDKARSLKRINFNSENDHRLFMMFCIAGMYIGDCTVSDPCSVDVSYPNFIYDVNKAGGKIVTM